MPALVPDTYHLDVALFDGHEGMLQLCFAAGSIEVGEVNYLGMSEPVSVGFGNFLVRSEWALR
jgi:hypothetical protein